MANSLRRLSIKRQSLCVNGFTCQIWSLTNDKCYSYMYLPNLVEHSYFSLLEMWVNVLVYLTGEWLLFILLGIVIVNLTGRIVMSI